MDGEALAELERTTGLEKKTIVGTYKEFQKASKNTGTLSKEQFIEFVRFSEKQGHTELGRAAGSDEVPCSPCSFRGAYREQSHQPTFISI